jgi:isoaspartyl peptidase/L-asparaginase-like protein (Ntn-hydrolase superfamily)
MIFIPNNVAFPIHIVRLLSNLKNIKNSSKSFISSVRNNYKILGSIGGGVVAIYSKGNIAMPFSTAGMYRACIDTEGKLTVSIYKD